MAEEMNIIGAESSSDLGQELNISLSESDIDEILGREGDGGEPAEPLADNEEDGSVAGTVPAGSGRKGVGHDPRRRHHDGLQSGRRGDSRPHRQLVTDGLKRETEVSGYDIYSSKSTVYGKAQMFPPIQ